MTDQDTRKIVLGWWQSHIGARDQAHAKALCARLRRGVPVEILCEPAVQELAKALQLGPGQALDLVRMLSVLAEVREHKAPSLAKRLGGDNSVLSRLRFQRLLRAEGDELGALLRRAVIMAGRECDVARLAGDLLHWTETTRIRWTFDYFGADAPQSDLKEISQ